jgi:hypothetical protein
MMPFGRCVHTCTCVQCTWTLLLFMPSRVLSSCYFYISHAPPEHPRKFYLLSQQKLPQCFNEKQPLWRMKRKQNHPQREGIQENARPPWCLLVKLKSSPFGMLVLSNCGISLLLYTLFLRLSPRKLLFWVLHTDLWVLLGLYPYFGLDKTTEWLTDWPSAPGGTAFISDLGYCR